jgi:uncharacterized RDD family membrane protein YckC
LNDSTAGFASRLMAFVIDIFVVGFICLLVTQAIVLTSEFFHLQNLRFWRRVVSAACSLAVSAVIVSYLPVSWTMTSRSVGKAIMGLAIVCDDGRRLTFGRSLLRLIGYWLSALPLGAGFLWAIFDARRRAWHDILAKTRVVHRARTP